MRSLYHAARVVNLTRTVTFGGLDYDRLVIREMAENDFRPVPPHLVDEDVARLLIARACGIPIGVVRALAPGDETRALDIVEPMLRANTPQAL